MPRPIPLQQRIELAEAFVELAWARLQTIPPPRSGVIEVARYQRQRDAAMWPIDAMLDALLGMYDERALTGVASCETPEGT